MKFNRHFTSAVIIPASMLLLVACGSDSDDDVDAPTEVLLFDEITDGDIVNDPDNPQPLQLIVGNNRINATMVAPDLDYVTINVPAGSELTAIELTEYISVDEQQSFIAIQAGSVFTVLPDNAAAEVANLLGLTLFSSDMIGTDILPAIAEGAIAPDDSAQGFTPPLEAGDYSFWIQDTSADTVAYSLTFEVRAAN